MGEQSTGPGNGGPGTTVGIPRWVKVFGIVSIVVVALVVIVLIVGGGNHGPSRHTGGLGGLSAVTAAGVQQI